MYNGLKITVVVPTRGDRPQFLNHCKWLISRQSVLPDEIIIVDDPPISNNKDITRRYRVGTQRAVSKGCDIIIFAEDDDWYAQNYIERMLEEWEKAGQPDLFGLATTCYYHLGTRRWTILKHPGRASAMSTMIKTDVMKKFRWPPDNFVFFDIELWKQLAGKAIEIPDWLCVGIKHGIGLSGGKGHNREWASFDRFDPSLDHLKSVTDAESFLFYEKISNSIK